MMLFNSFLWAAALATLAQVALNFSIFDPVVATVLGRGQQLLIDQSSNRPGSEAQSVSGFVRGHLFDLFRYPVAHIITFAVDKFLNGLFGIDGFVIGGVDCFQAAGRQCLAVDSDSVGNHCSRPFCICCSSDVYKIPRYPILVKHYFRIGL
jgi:hypothetical protein